MFDRFLGTHVPMIYPCDFAKDEIGTLGDVLYLLLQTVTNLFFIAVLSLFSEVSVSFGFFCLLWR